MIRNIFILILFLFSKDSIGQLFVARDTICVIENNYVLKMPWANGINYSNISSTDLNYDGKKITGVLYKSSDITKCSNFFNKTGLYVIVLESDWYGYPDFLGECDIFGLEGDVVVNENTLIPLPDQNTNFVDSSNSKLKSQKSSLNTNYTWMLVCVAIVVAIVILMILYKKIKKHKRR